MPVAWWKKLLTSVAPVRRRATKPSLECLEDRTVPSGNPPTALVNAPPPLAEGAVLSLDASRSTDPEGDFLTYSWDINGDGVFGDATGVQPTLTAAQREAISPALNDGPRSFNVRVRVSDGTSTVTSGSVLLQVTNVAPNPLIEGAPGNVPEGTVIALTDAGTDPSTADVQAGLNRSWEVIHTTSLSALSFDGNDYVRLDRPVENDFTIEGWIRTDAPSLTGSQFFQGNGVFYADAPGVKDDFGASILNGRFAFGTGNPDTTAQSTTIVNTGQWVHVAAVRQAATGTLRVFVNGVEEGSRVTTNTRPLSASLTMDVGGNTLDNRFFRGQIDEFRVWNVVRTAAEIQADMNRSLSGTESGLVVYWHLNEGSGTTTLNAVGPAFQGTFAPGKPATQFPTWVTSTAPLQGTVVTASGTGSSFNFTPADDGTYAVTLRATDKDGGVGVAMTTVVATNAAPTGDLAPLAVVREGGSATLAFMDLVDPSSVDSSAGFQYSFDLDNDGVFDLIDVSSSSVEVPAALLPDGPGEHTLSARVTDKDGGFTDYTVTFPVLNVAPTADVTADELVNEGDPVTVTLSDFFDPSALDTAAGFRFAFAADGASLNGTTYDTSSSEPSATFVFDGDGRPHTVTARIFDRDNGYTDYHLVVAVQNVAPTAFLFNGGAVSEGTAGLVRFTNQFDPSSEDTLAGFTYSYDFDCDGVFEIENVTDASAVVPASWLADGPAERTICGRITDKDGGFNEYTTTISVHNVNPTVSLGVSSGAVEGAEVVLTSDVTDPGADTFTYSWRVSRGGTVIAEGSNPTLRFTPDDNGSYAVSLVVRDDDGGTATVGTSVVVGNVAPTAAFSGTDAVDEGSTAVVAFAAPGDVSTADAAAGFRYSYDLDNDGTFEIADIADTSMVVSAIWLADGAGGRTVRGRITDKDGGFTDYLVTIEIRNVAPTVTIPDAPARTPRGQAMKLSRQVADPGTDTFQQHWKVKRGGAVVAEGEGEDFDFTPTEAGTHEILLTVTDDDGGVGETTVVVEVDEVAPSDLPAIDGPADGVRGQRRVFLLSATGEAATVVEYRIDWGDGSAVQTVTGPASGLEVTHIFTEAGQVTIAVSIDGGPAATLTHTTHIVALQADTADPTKTVLVVGGTPDDDEISFRYKRRKGVEVQLNGDSLGWFEPTGGVMAFGQAGDDDLLVRDNVELSAWLDGGDGDDRLRGGDLADVLLGGAGDDTLVGRDGRDLLIGGDGADDLRGKADEDLVVAGWTAYDAHDVALRAILDEWNSSRSYKERVANISGTGCGRPFEKRLNGNYFLTLSGNATVFNDGDRDIVRDASGEDWDIVDVGDKVKPRKKR